MRKDFIFSMQAHTALAQRAFGLLPSSATASPRLPRKNVSRQFPFQHGFAPAWRGAVSHSTPTEQAMLFAWLDQVNPQPLQLWYDVPFDGKPGTEPPAVTVPHGTHPNFARMWQRLNSKRADAVASWRHGYQLIELRPEAKPQTIGEISQYRYLAA
jgi:hypothetical protein